MNGSHFCWQEMVDMIWIFGQYHKNCLLAAWVYHERYPERRQPNKRAFKDQGMFLSKITYKKVEVTTPYINEEN